MSAGRRLHGDQRAAGRTAAVPTPASARPWAWGPGRLLGRGAPVVRADHRDPPHRGRPDDRDLRPPRARRADLHLGNPMTATPQFVTTGGADQLSATARDHLWMHFTRHSTYEDGGEVPIIVRG